MPHEHAHTHSHSTYHRITLEVKRENQARGGKQATKEPVFVCPKANKLCTPRCTRKFRGRQNDFDKRLGFIAVRVMETKIKRDRPRRRAHRPCLSFVFFFFQFSILFIARGERGGWGLYVLYFGRARNIFIVGQLDPFLTS